MSKKTSFDKKHVAGPPEGQNWCWLTREFLEAPAWRARSLQCGRFIEFLMIEHLTHAGTENGNLAAPFAQLEKFGIGRRYIAPAISEAVSLRLVAMHSGGLRAYNRASMSRFRLTFYASRECDETGHPYYAAPTNDWRKTTEAEALAVRTARPKQPPPRKIQMPGAHPVTASGDTLSPEPVHTLSPLKNGNIDKMGISELAPVVTPCPTLSISWGGGGAAGSHAATACRPDAALMLRLVAGSPIACMLLLVAAHPQTVGRRKLIPADDLGRRRPTE